MMPGRWLIGKTSYGGAMIPRGIGSRLSSQRLS